MTALTLVLALFAHPASADVSRSSPAVFECPRDANGDRLTVTLNSSPGPQGGFIYDITAARGEPALWGKLAKSWVDPTFPVELTGKDVRIKVSTVELHDIPVTQVRVSYQVLQKNEVTAVCTKGAAFPSLFTR